MLIFTPVDCNFAFAHDLSKHHYNMQFFPLSVAFFLLSLKLPQVICVSKDKKELELGQTIRSKDYIKSSTKLNRSYLFAWEVTLVCPRLGYCKQKMSKIRILWEENVYQRPTPKVHWNIIKSCFAQNHTQKNHRGYLNLDDLNVQLLQHEVPVTVNMHRLTHSAGRH